MSKTLRLILGDQLNPQHSWFRKVDQHTTYVLMEIMPEATYVTHHIQKLLGFFAAMRRFADELQKQGHQCIYLHLVDPQNQQSFAGNLKQILTADDFKAFEYQEPDEYRVDQILKQFADRLSVPVTVYDSEHFLTRRHDLQEFFAGSKTLLMESFYRHMRKKYHILMEEDKPAGGRWNFDRENRRRLPAKADVPAPLLFDHDLTDIYEMIQSHKIPSIGKVDSRHFTWPLHRQEALQVLEDFLENRLLYFGTYQDAMHTAEPYVYHSRLSFAMNTKMIHPAEIVERALSYWKEEKERINLAQIEGFVRQIIGWREYMRGVYWAYMPEYETRNFFSHSRKLPDFYWTAETKMNCLKHAIQQSIDHAYAHHIQRLMITGNFALLAGIHPDEVDAWYMGIYMDAIQWVEITNTRGMSQFADGGLVGTKPYVSSANYINKMSNYCQGCHYDHRQRYGAKACPFNSLYWNFYDRHRGRLQKNPRVGMAYRLLESMPDSELQHIRKQAAAYLDQLNSI